MNRILEYSQEKISKVESKFKRYLFNDIMENNNKIIGIV
jgi:hypothetical protein